MEELTSDSEESSYSKDWIDWFLSLKGNEFFCEVDNEYIVDKFNLTGLNMEVAHYANAIDLITDRFDDEDVEDDIRDEVEKSARHLYGLIHARFVITSRGLAKMAEKYRNGDFTFCPRVYCSQQALIPLGMSDVPHQKCVKLYCPSCEDLYNPKAPRNASLDGAYFGTSLPQLLLMVYPQLAVRKDVRRYKPTIFGFKIWEVEILHRMQDLVRRDMKGAAEQPVGVPYSSSDKAGGSTSAHQALGHNPMVTGTQGVLPNGNGRLV